MGRAEKNKVKRVSVLNWMGTLIVCGIPGVNLIALILFIIFAKAQSKRSFAIACLLLWVLLIVAVCALFLLLPEKMADLAAMLRGSGAVLPLAQGSL